MSCTDQLREARSYAHLQGWTIAGEYKDEGISGTKGREDRPGFDEMLGFIEAGNLPGGVVLAWDWDRWSRDPYDGPIARMSIQRLGIDVADTVVGVFGRDFAGQIMATVKEQGAADFITKLRRGVRRGLTAKREAGYWTCPPPFGFTTARTEGGSVLVALPAEAKWVVRIYQWIDEGLTPAAVARRLNSEGVSTKRDSKWTPSTVRGIASSPVFIGKIARYNSRAGGSQRSRHQIPKSEVEVFEGRHAGLVASELWDRVQARLEIVPRGPNSLRSFPLSGLVVCESCGRACQVTGGAWPHRNYRCRPYGVTTECPSKRIVRVSFLEDAVRKWALSMAEHPEAVRIAALQIVETEWKGAREVAAERSPIESQIADLKLKESRLLEALYAGNAPAVINSKLRAIQDDLEVAHTQLLNIGAATSPMSLNAVTGSLASSLRAGAVDLFALCGLIEKINLPLDHCSPPVLIAFAQRFELSLQRPIKRRLPKP